MRCSLNSKLALGHCPSNYSKFNGKIWRFESILPADNNTLNYCGMIESTVGTGTQVMEVVNWGFEPFIVTMASSLDVALVIFFPSYCAFIFSAFCTPHRTSTFLNGLVETRACSRASRLGDSYPRLLSRATLMLFVLFARKSFVTYTTTTRRSLL